MLLLLRDEGVEKIEPPPQKKTPMKIPHIGKANALPARYISKGRNQRQCSHTKTIFKDYP
jgi:hypothetical protein